MDALRLDRSRYGCPEHVHIYIYMQSLRPDGLVSSSSRWVDGKPNQLANVLDAFAGLNLLDRVASS